MRHKIRFLPLAVLVLAGVLSLSQVESHTGALRYPGEIFSKDSSYKVLKVVDGDTIKIDYKGKTESVRLIGVDTPETLHFAGGQRWPVSQTIGVDNDDQGRTQSHYDNRPTFGFNRSDF